MARKTPPPPYLDELTFDARQIPFVLLRDGHLRYLDPHLLALLRGEPRDVGELEQLARGNGLEGLSEHVIWRWLQSAWKRGLVARVAEPLAPGGSRLWQVTEAGEKRANPLLSYVKSARGAMALVSPALAVFGGAAGVAATIQRQPLIAFAILGLTIGMANRIVLNFIVIQRLWLQGRVVRAKAIEKEEQLQAFLRRGEMAPPMPAPSLKPTADGAGIALITSPLAVQAAGFFWGLGYGFSITGFSLSGDFGQQHPYLLATVYWIFFFVLHDAAFTCPGIRRTLKGRAAPAAAAAPEVQAAQPAAAGK